MSLRKKLSRIFRGKDNDVKEEEASRDVPSLELSPEEEEELIEKIVNKVKQYGLKSAALLFLRSYKPVGPYGAQIAPTILGQFFFLFDLFEIDAFKYNALFMNRESIDKLIKRIEEI